MSNGIEGFPVVRDTLLDLRNGGEPLSDTRCASGMKRLESDSLRAKVEE